jgi:hypothetical protein
VGLDTHRVPAESFGPFGSPLSLGFVLFSWRDGNPGFGKTAPGQGEMRVEALASPQWPVDTLLPVSLPRCRRGFAFLARMGASLDDIGFALSKTW